MLPSEQTKKACSEEEHLLFEGSVVNCVKSAAAVYIYTLFLQLLPTTHCLTKCKERRRKIRRLQLEKNTYIF